VSCDRDVPGQLGATIERTLMRELNYLDFDLVVERAGPGTYRARVTDAPAGETAPAQFAVPFSDLEIDNFLLRIGRPRRAPVAVAALERLHAAQPDRSDVSQQLEHARTQKKIAALTVDLRRLHDARQWQAVIAVGEQLAEIDPQLADQDGLVSSAKTELAEEALADRYRAGLLQLDRGDRAAAAETFAAIEAARPGYRDAAALLARARERPAEPEQQPAPAQEAPAPPRPALPPETPSPSRGEPTDSGVPASTPTRTPQSEGPPASPQPPPDAPSPPPAAPAQAGTRTMAILALILVVIVLLILVL
jgi:hypothetical protein